VIFILVFLVLFPGVCWAETTGEAGSLLDELDLSQLDDAVKVVNDEIDQALPDLDFRSLVASLVRGELGYHPGDFVNAIWRYLFQEVIANVALLGKMVVLAVICAVLQNIANAFEKSTTSRVAYTAVYLALITIAAGSFMIALNTGREAVENMVVFMHAMLPVMLALLCAVGGFTSAALIHPVIVVVMNGAANVVKNVVLPLILFSAILGMISHLASGFSLSRLADLLRYVGIGVMGVLTTIFLGVLTIQGVASAVAEGVAYRTAKYASQAFLPVVGKMFSDAMEMIVGSSLLVKNAVGLAGLLLIFLMVLFPLLKIIVLVFIYKLAAALVQPLGEDRLSDCLNTMGNSMTAVFAVVATTALLFFFALALMTGLGNLTVMLR
jgi:stage III sporulation protein AE